jgi:hypothetical protein
MSFNETKELSLLNMRAGAVEVRASDRLLSQRPVFINGADFNPFCPPNPTEGIELIGANVVVNGSARNVWREVFSETPELWDTRIENFTHLFETKNPLSGGTYDHPKSEKDSPKIRLPKDWERPADFLKTPKGSLILEHIAQGIGIPVGNVSSDLTATFALVHELGHAVHSTGQTFEQHTKRRESELATLPARSFADFLSKFLYATTQETRDFLLRYRHLPSEVEADNFAFGVLVKHLKLIK